jgi:hypothetical protein
MGRMGRRGRRILMSDYEQQPVRDDVEVSVNDLPAGEENASMDFNISRHMVRNAYWDIHNPQQRESVATQMYTSINIKVLLDQHQYWIWHSLL